LDLLEQGEEAFDSLRSPFSPRAQLWTAVTIGGVQGQAQNHGFLIGDVDEACVAGRLAQGMNDKTTPKKGMSRIGDLNRLGIWVLEVGIKK
jgi:hypothetical protein